MKIFIQNSFVKFDKDMVAAHELTIENVFVQKNKRSEGIGRDLVERVLNYAKKSNYKTVGLFAEPQTDDGLEVDDLIEFYQSCGFRSDGDCSELMTYTI